MNEKAERDVRSGLVSMELPDGNRAWYVLNEGITSKEILTLLAQSNELHEDIKRVGKQIGEVEYAVIEQSEQCTFSIEYREGKADLFVINEEKGGIDEGLRTEDNISFEEIDLTSYQEEKVNIEELIEKLIQPEDIKEYTFEITEVLSRKITVEADSQTEAQEKIEDMYGSGEIVLNADDYIDNNIEFVSYTERKPVQDIKRDNEDSLTEDKNRNNKLRMMQGKAR